MTMLLSPQLPPEESAERLDAVLRSSLVAGPPPDLAARLLQLAHQPAPAVTRLDLAIQSAVVIEPPAELTARLLALVPQAAPLATSKPMPGWIKLLYAVTALALGVLIVVAAQFFQQMLAQVGAAELWTQISSLPAQGLERVYTVAPRAYLLVEVYQALQRPLQWLLAGLVLWAVLEMASTQRRQLA